MNFEPERRDNSKLYMLLGQLQQAQEDHGRHLTNHCETEDLDRKELKDGILKIQLKLAKGIECPHEETIENSKDAINSMKGERKFLYGGLLAIFAAIAKKLFG